MSLDLAGYILIAPSNNSIFTNSLTNDVMLYPQSNSQCVLIGNNQGSNANITMTSNFNSFTGAMSIVGGLATKGVQIIQADGTDWNITSCAITPGLSNVAAGVLMAMSNNTSNYSFRFKGNNVEVGRITGDANVVMVRGISASNTGMFRNRIINGSMQVDQRLSGAQSGNITTYGYYSADRWFFDAYSGTFASGAVKIQQVVDAPSASGCTHSLKITVPTVLSFPNKVIAPYNQYIEGYNVADFLWGTTSGTPVTLSFWAKTNVTGTHLVCIMNSSGANSYVGTFTVSVADTWEYKSLTIPAPPSGSTWLADNGIGISVRIFLQEFGTSSYRVSAINTWQTATAYGSVPSSGYANTLFTNTANYVQLTGVQFEKGTVATPFEFRAYPLELGLCRRYYELVQPVAAAFAYGMNTYGPGGANNLWWNFKKTKRTSPTMVSGTITGGNGSVSIYTSPDMVAFRIDVGSYIGFWLAVSGNVAFSAELNVMM
jgi:hypothetical protein